jgi:hypothetical protein
MLLEIGNLMTKTSQKMKLVQFGKISKLFKPATLMPPAT